MKIFRISQETISLNQLVGESFGDDELVWRLADEFALDADYQIPVTTISPESMRNLNVYGRDMKVIEAFDKFSTINQQQLVEDYKRSNLSNEIIIIESEALVDGHHRVVAAIQTNQTMKCVDIADIPD
jgi:hypothetical protein